MALIRNILAGVLCVAALASCSSGNEQTNTALSIEVLSRVFNPQEISQLTATRASLQTSGFDEPLLVATLSQPTPIKAGLLLDTKREGVAFWRGADGSLVKTVDGVLSGTVGIPFDLYGADTAATLDALRGGKSQGYPRVYRHLTELNQLTYTRFFCSLGEPTPETIVVFDRRHRTVRYSERCTAQRRGADGIIPEIENVYWKDPNRLFIWKSEQWISTRTGTILLERVFE